MITENPQTRECLHDILYFFEFYGIKEIESQLWDLLSYALSGEDVDHWDGKRRSAMLHFYKLLQQLLIGAYSLVEPFIGDTENKDCSCD